MLGEKIIHYTGVLWSHSLCQHQALCWHFQLWQTLATEGVFPGGEPIVDFSRGSQKELSRGLKMVKFHFSLSKLRKQPFC